MSTTLVTVSDDRFGRKNGAYKATQHKLTAIIKRSELGINNFFNYTFADNIIGTDFYNANKVLLDDPDPSRNGRAYKPYTILKALEGINDGDFIIYNDCSPELWAYLPDEAYINQARFNIEIIKELCLKNNGILTAFIVWPGGHTHKKYTMDRCMRKMGLEHFAGSYQHASGMWAIQKSDRTVNFVKEWLYYNCIDECCGMGWSNIPNDQSFWLEEWRNKEGHRHDQSISGLLINKIENRLVEVPGDHFAVGLHPYNFLQFCRQDALYNFRESNP